MDFTEGCRADVAGSCRPLVTIMLLSWLRSENQPSAVFYWPPLCVNV